MKTLRSLWRLLKISWTLFHVKAFAVFVFKVINLIRYFRRLLFIIFFVIHLMFFFNFFGWFELSLFYFLLIEVSGPEVDKYLDYDDDIEEEVQTFDYVFPKEEYEN